DAIPGDLLASTAGDGPTAGSRATDPPSTRLRAMVGDLGDTLYHGSFSATTRREDARVSSSPSDDDKDTLASGSTRAVSDAAALFDLSDCNVAEIVLIDGAGCLPGLLAIQRGDTLASSDVQSSTRTNQLIQRRMDVGKTNRFIQRRTIFGESYFGGDQMDGWNVSK
ncbi:hypothetical protein THAOC_01737, partial [Thalassiosira oceanica]